MTLKAVKTKRNIAGYYDEQGRFRPIRKPSYVGPNRRPAKRVDRSKYSRAKAGDLGPDKQAAAIEADEFDWSTGLTKGEMAADERLKQRALREIEKESLGDNWNAKGGLTLVDFVRGEGGLRRHYRLGGQKNSRGEKIAWDAGEIDRLSYKETGKRGLTTDDPKRGKTIDKMFQAALEAGFDLDGHSDMLDRLEDEATGGRKTYATGGFRDYTANPAKSAMLRTLTVYNKDHAVRFVLVHDGSFGIGGFGKQFKTLAAAKKWATMNKAAVAWDNPALSDAQLRAMAALNRKALAAFKKGGRVAGLRVVREASGLSINDVVKDIVRREVETWHEYRKTNPEPIAAFAALAGGIASSLAIADRLNRKSTAKKNPKGDVYRLAVKRGDDVMSVYMRDKNRDGFMNTKRKKSNPGRWPLSWRSRNNGRVTLVTRSRNGLVEEVGWLPNESDVRLVRQKTKQILDSLSVLLHAANYVTKYQHLRRVFPTMVFKGRYAFAEKRRSNPAMIGLELVGRAAKAAARAEQLPAKRNAGWLVGGIKRMAARRRAASAYKKELRASAALDRAKSRRKSAEMAARSNPNSVARRRTFEMFQGRAAETAKHYPASAHAPARLDQLGDLVEVAFTDGRIIKVNPDRFKLCAARGKMWIVGGRFAKSNPAVPAREINPIGEIKHVVYGTYKPHHGDNEYTHYIHELGEDSGRRPTLCVDNKGFPVIRGGAYKIEARGIVD